MHNIGIDIGSTTCKSVVIKDGEIVCSRLLPTGWSAKNTASEVKNFLRENGYLEDAKIIATGYGRVSVDYADKSLTEISCHARGADHLFNQDGTVIDIGGQDMKIVKISKGKVLDFYMNDKCSAGTGKFLDMMANSLGIDIDMMSDMARRGGGVTISSMCTVFAESEVISLIAAGTRREDICNGIIASLVDKVVSLAAKTVSEKYFLTGGLCENEYILERLSDKLGARVESDKLARYAGAIGAAIFAGELR